MPPTSVTRPAVSNTLAVRFFIGFSFFGAGSKEGPGIMEGRVLNLSVVQRCNPSIPDNAKMVRFAEKKCQCGSCLGLERLLGSHPRGSDAVCEVGSGASPSKVQLCADKPAFAQRRVIPGIGTVNL